MVALNFEVITEPLKEGGNCLISQRAPDFFGVIFVRLSVSKGKTIKQRENRKDESRRSYRSCPTIPKRPEKTWDGKTQ